MQVCAEASDVSVALWQVSRPPHERTLSCVLPCVLPCVDVAVNGAVKAHVVHVKEGRLGREDR